MVTWYRRRRHRQLARSRRDQGVAKSLVDDSREARGHGKTIHPHPTLGESIGMAAEVAHGACTDVPPGRKQTPHSR
jgi:hypothetical protein